MSEDVDSAIARAEQAQRLLDDPLFKETSEAVHDALIRAVKSAKTEQEAYKAAIAMQVFDLLVGQFKSYAETKKVMEFNFRNKRFGIL